MVHTILLPKNLIEVEPNEPQKKIEATQEADLRPEVATRPDLPDPQSRSGLILVVQGPRLSLHDTQRNPTRPDREPDRFHHTIIRVDTHQDHRGLRVLLDLDLIDLVLGIRNHQGILRTMLNHRADLDVDENTKLAEVGEIIEKRFRLPEAEVEVAHMQALV